MSRSARLLVGAATLLLAGTAVAGCGASAGDLAKAACVKVDAAVHLYSEAGKTSDQTQAAALREQAYVDLLKATPIAAQAAYHSLQWEVLSTTLSEANRVPVPSLLPDLQSQCRDINSSPFGQPSSPQPNGNTGG